MESHLDSRPSLAELMREVCLTAEWHHIGVMLDLDPDKLNAIHHSTTSVSDKTSDMYKLWLDSKPQATRRQLVEVLESMDLNRKALDYKKYLKGKITSFA
uniref:Death domain-containing protein n=1 Tax=Amphimedon queenslandica TaxID=400682 RepID=A0A1X7TG41_AMPQE